MRNLLFLIAAALGALLPSCTPANRRPGRQDFCSENEFGGAVHRCIHAVSHLIEDHAEHAGIPLRFAASKIIEGDHLILQKLELDENEHEAMEHLIVQMEKERGLDRSAAIADMRFNFIEKVCEKTVVKPKASPTAWMRYAASERSSSR